MTKIVLAFIFHGGNLRKRDTLSPGEAGVVPDFYWLKPLRLPSSAQMMEVTGSPGTQPRPPPCTCRPNCPGLGIHPAESQQCECSNLNAWRGYLVLSHPVLSCLISVNQP